MEGIRTAWFQLCYHLIGFPARVRGQIRTIRLPYDFWFGPCLQPAKCNHCPTTKRLLQAEEGPRICDLFRRLDNVHPTLKVEIDVALKQEHPWSLLRRVYTLQQQPAIVTEQGDADWVCTGSQLLKWQPAPDGLFTEVQFCEAAALNAIDNERKMAWIPCQEEADEQLLAQNS